MIFSMQFLFRSARIISIIFLLPIISIFAEASGELEVVFLDVDQGDSTLVTTPEGKHILIDGGVGEGYGTKDQGKKTILPYLRKNGINKLDTMVITHPDFDHIGGLISVVKFKPLQIGEVLDPGQAHPSEAYLELLKAIQERPEIQYSQPRAGDMLDWGEDVRVEVLSPPYLLEDNNECSIVIKLTYGDISFLLTGDAAGTAEKLMMGKYAYRLRSTVLKAGHHGSSHSTGEEFLGYVSPRVVIVSSGKDNKYGHPAEEVIDRVKKRGADIYRTDQHGTITIITDGENYQVETEKDS